MKRFFATICAVLLGAASVAWGAETGSMIKADELKAEPFRDAKALGKLATGDKIEILKREGAWYQVKSAKGAKGWVRMLNVRRGEAKKASATSTATGVANLASGRAGTGQVVATTGIRGLNEQELKSAQFNEAELKRAESFGVPAQEAQTFAQAGKLAARKVKYLKAPAESR
ncbi:MAG: SH3 domain-containing protein [Pseudomonadota bacterium]